MAATLDFEQIADELYGLRPDEFTAARDEHIARVKADGHRELARELGKLRRPTQTAWLVNQVWRDQREQIEELLALADDFGAAMAAGDGKQLQALTVKRRELEGRLVRRATALADGAGIPANADTMHEVQETLGAALVSPEAADQVRSGRLVRALSYSGFGPGLGAVGQAAPARPAKKAPSAPKEATAERTDTESDVRRTAAEHELAEAHEAVSAAEAALADRSRAAEQAEEEHEALSDRLAELREQVRELDQQVVAAKQVAAREHRRLEKAKKAYERARAAVERAEKRLG